jgi:hypothetical protein
LEVSNTGVCFDIDSVVGLLLTFEVASLADLLDTRYARLLGCFMKNTLAREIWNFSNLSQPFPCVKTRKFELIPKIIGYNLTCLCSFFWIFERSELSFFILSLYRTLFQSLHSHHNTQR